jgi:hypothetical protein
MHGRLLFPLLLFAALTAVATFPQIRDFTSVPYHSDPYFSMWRLAWIAHAIRTTPKHLFDANIFYPERFTLAYSDAMLLPGVIFAPLFWIGVGPAHIYNLALFAAFTLSGLTAFSLARLLTGNVSAAIIAGVIYAYSPYRFTHYLHLELQLVFWIPLLLLALHRALPRITTRDGVLLGTLMGLQLLSCIYVGIFTALFFVIFVPCLLWLTGIPAWRGLIKPVAAAGGIALLLALPYAYAYTGARSTVGTRTVDQVTQYSATWSHFLAAPEMNRLYGGTAITDVYTASEMNLFPGVVAVLLALAGTVAGKDRMRLPYIAGLLFALVMTAGVNAGMFLWLFDHVALFRALRSPARFDILVVLCLAVLSAYGATALLDRIRTQGRRTAVASAIVALLMVEYASSPTIYPVPPPSQVDRYLSLKQGVVIAQLPVASDLGAFGSTDWLYMFQGRLHFHKMLNGYSGYGPPSYLAMRQVMSGFPDDGSIQFLRNHGVGYIVIRGGLFEPKQRMRVMERILRRQELVLEATWSGGPYGDEALLRLEPTTGQ